MDWVNNNIFFLGNLSIMVPANSENRVTGKNCTAAKIPNNSEEFVSDNTSQDCPILCIHVPIKEKHCPIQ
jgi:hypothetical protein